MKTYKFNVSRRDLSLRAAFASDRAASKLTTLGNFLSISPSSPRTTFHDAILSFWYWNLIALITNNDTIARARKRYICRLRASVRLPCSVASRYADHKIVTMSIISPNIHSRKIQLIHMSQYSSPVASIFVSANDAIVIARSLRSTIVRSCAGQLFCQMGCLECRLFDIPACKLSFC